MVFNSNVFLFAFLPITFALFWAARNKTQRYVPMALSGFVLSRGPSPKTARPSGPHEIAIAGRGH